jgi:predicted restriction endonuclease
MPDLPPVIEEALRRFESEIYEMRRGGDDEHPKPHKLIMLLAVIDLAECGQLYENRVYFDEPLFSRFESHFRLLCGPDDWCQPGTPFFHMRTSGFWHHMVITGREKVYRSLTTSGGGRKRIADNIEYAYLSEYAYLVIRDRVARQCLREWIMSLLAIQGVSTSQ